jgi:copper oxidase (laccase) domain-containing protein
VTRVAWATQVHGIQVRDAYPDSPSDGTAAAAPPAVTHLGEGDALVSSRGGVAVCVLTADCGALALSSPEGIFAAVHAGWRGLVGGVVEAAVAHMRQLGSTDVVGSLGPCIHAECYEFSTHDLDEVAAACGPGVRGRTSDGRPALDLTAGIISSLAKAGAVVAPGVDICTACGDGYFSHRVRRDSGRQALLVWGGSTARPS